MGVDSEASLNEDFIGLDKMTQQIVQELESIGFTSVELSPGKVVMELTAKPGNIVTLFITGGIYTLNLEKTGGRDMTVLAGVGMLDSRDKVVQQVENYFF
jgi:hypothetical protein